MLSTERPGQQPYLNKEEEKDLAKFVEVVADIGFGKTRKQIKAMVEKAAHDKKVLRKEKINDGWFRQFWNANLNFVCVKVIVQWLLELIL